MVSLSLECLADKLGTKLGLGWTSHEISGITVAISEPGIGAGVHAWRHRGQPVPDLEC